MLLLLQRATSNLLLPPSDVLVAAGDIGGGEVKLFFMNKTGGGGGEREMKRLMARERSKEDLKDVFSVMYVVILSKIFSNICFTGLTMGG